MLVSIAAALQGFAFLPVKLPPTELLGSFFTGTGYTTSSIELRKNGSFVYSAWGCLGEADRNDGRWSYDGTNVVLKPRSSKKSLVWVKQHDLALMGTSFVPVKWGRLAFLVRKSKLASFMNLPGSSTPAAKFYHIDLAYCRESEGFWEQNRADFASYQGMIDIQVRGYVQLPSEPARHWKLVGQNGSIEIHSIAQSEPSSRREPK